MRVAITGGIGVGKSYVCRRLAQHGIQVYDCDAAAKRLMRTSPVLREQLCQLVGDEVYLGDTLCKHVLARFIVESEADKQAVNAIVHPAVASDFMASGYTWLESAILFESGFHQRVHFDVVICVTAPLETRINRIVQRDGIGRTQAMEWIERQMPQEQVAAQSQYVIVNDGRQDIDKQINQILKSISETNKMETILSIAGKPGLYKLVSRGKMNLIVETLDDNHRRMPAFATDRVTSLADIAMYTDADDIPLWQVLKNVGEKEQNGPCQFDYKKASSKDLRAYFSSVLPNFDQDRVHDSDIKKLLQWYNILVTNGYTDFEAILAPTEGDNVDDRENQ